LYIPLSKSDKNSFCCYRRDNALNLSICTFTLPFGQTNTYSNRRKAEKKTVFVSPTLLIIEGSYLFSFFLFLIYNNTTITDAPTHTIAKKQIPFIKFCV